MASSSKSVADRLKVARKRSAKILERGSKVEARLAGPKTKLDLVVATLNDLDAKKARLQAKGGAGSGEKVRKIDARRAKLIAKRAKLEKRVGPMMARLEKLRGRLEKHADTINRLGGS